MPELPTVPDVPPSGSGSPPGGSVEAAAAGDEAVADGRVDGTVILGGAADDDPDADVGPGTDAGIADPVAAVPATVDEHATASAATSSSATAGTGARRRSGNRATSEPYKAPPSAHGERGRTGIGPR